MRKQKLVLILVMLIFTGNVIAQSGWQWVNPTPQGNSLNDCQFINENVVIAVGNYGTILKSSNAGSNWQRINLTTTENFIKMYFSNALTGIVVSTSGYKIRTVDGGINWSVINSPTTGNVTTMSFFDANNGIIAGFNSLLYKTTNGGLNWISITTPFNVRSIRNVSMINENQFYVFCEANYIVSEGSWQTIELPNVLWHNVYIDKSNLNKRYLCGNSKIAYTNNGGGNWKVSRDIPADIYEIMPFDSLNIVTLGTAGIYKTTNGGNFWYDVFDHAHLWIVPFLGMSFSTSGNGVIVGTNGLVFSSSNSGENWQWKYNSEKLGKLSVVKKIGFNSVLAFGVTGNFLRTTNGGDGWSSEWINNGKDFSDAIFLDSLTGFASITKKDGSPVPPFFWVYGGIYKTTDAGANWSNIYSSSQYLVKGVSFTNINTGYISGSMETVTTQREAILKTTNGGLNWTSIYEAPNRNSILYKNCFLNELTGYVSGDSGKIVKTTNGGINWINVPVNTSNSFTNVKFFNELTGYASGNSVNLAFTTNGGQNWSLIPTSADSAINSIYFFDVNKGYVLSNRKLSFTSNGGSSWTAQNIYCEYGLNDLVFTDLNTGYIVGETGTILRTTDAGNVFVSNTSSEIPDHFLLHQNYPNPFNPSTKINYEIKSSGFVTLKVFDLLGKEVATLVNEKQNAGSYAIDFNSSEFSLPSGIYFYTLNTGEFKETKKMVLIK
ncbi:MAG: T9SS type A sorting domain-containing protein [Bacteroidetes bacterium]|nr:T9SS type A sorting domain-containing protein [Bacteroidota bacterium]